MYVDVDVAGRGVAGASDARWCLAMPDALQDPAAAHGSFEAPEQFAELVGTLDGGRRYGHAMDFRLELVTVPVSDVDRAKAFYVDKVGFNADHDHTVNPELRFVQLTPPGSACSIVLGGASGLGDMPPGSQRGLQVVVDDVRAARQHLVTRGVDVTEVDETPWGHFVFFADPDGNAWSVQQIVRP